MNDEEMICALIKDDDNALQLIAKKYMGYVCTVARNFSNGTLSENDIDEISITVFFKLWQARHDLDIKVGLPVYLSAATRNTIKNLFRNKLPVSVDLTEFEIASDFSVEKTVELNLMINCLNEGVATLSEQEQKIFLRFYLYGEKTSQIANAINISESSVRTKLYRIREKLKNYMTERGYNNV